MHDDAMYLKVSSSLNRIVKKFVKLHDANGKLFVVNQNRKVEALEFPECSCYIFSLLIQKSCKSKHYSQSFTTYFLGSLKGSRRSLLSYRIGCGSWFTNKSHLDNRCIGGLLLLYVENVAAKLRCIEH